MDDATLKYIEERANILATDDSSKQATKDAASDWLSAVKSAASDDEINAATEKFLDFLDGRPHTIDDVIQFAKGPAVELFGEDGAAQYLAMQEQRKSEGAKFCNCPACAAASEILAKFDRVEL